jgi:glycosyltransferase involved in cell wall biosynthesis
MKLYVDGRILEHSATGVAISTVYLYKEISCIYSDLDIYFIHRKPLKVKLPESLKSIHTGSYLSKSLWEQFLLPTRLVLDCPDIIHFPWNGNIPYFHKNLCTIMTLHDVLPLIIPNYFKTDLNRTKYINKVQSDINKSSTVVTVSDYSKKTIEDNFLLKSEPHVIRHGPTILLDHKLLEANSNGNYFLYVGGYDPRKGIESLLDVFISLYRNKKLLHKLILTGSVYYYSNELINLIDEGKSIGAVVEKGYVSETELLNLLASATALVYPSKYEGFGLPPLEAMYVGCPVITTTHTSLPEICGDAVYYIDPDDKYDLACSLVNLQNDSQLRKQLIDNGKIQASKFSWNIAAINYMNAVKTCL